MEIPAPTERAVVAAVGRRLERELGDRGVLLAPDDLAAAGAEAAERGARLRARVMHVCYQAGSEVEFEDEQTAARLDAALAFGAATADVLAERVADSVELVCAIFNLGIGLVDGLCDGDPETGAAVLKLVKAHDLSCAASERRDRGWLRSALPRPLSDNVTVAFTVDIVEAFFATLHAAYPDDPWLHLRRHVGTQLSAALDAEHRSVVRSESQTTQELLECSRLTSVLPFQIIDTLAGGHGALTEPGAGTQLGEAMWRIDDLVDLWQDARSGSLNSILLAAGPGASPEGLLDSTDIAEAAAEAADNLLAGLKPAGGDRRRTLPFLAFIHRYAGIPSRP